MPPWLNIAPEEASLTYRFISIKKQAAFTTGRDVHEPFEGRPRAHHEILVIEGNEKKFGGRSIQIDETQLSATVIVN
ncbi:hypothetical protein [Bradyrhizobium sp. 23]|uniref:hypothetical protein n=1 Tax=Bradyrhizobium sp. 23 TaxID=2782667 RepID=UPI001FFB659B|nr:hypothetical protein [Bradyrhizobium sp. 23]MCK1315396.1 hypothetical protein [Bradyrhizobium sp. 23]